MVGVKISHAEFEKMVAAMPQEAQAEIKTKAANEDLRNLDEQLAARERRPRRPAADKRSKSVPQYPHWNATHSEADGFCAFIVMLVIGAIVYGIFGDALKIVWPALLLL